MSISITSMSSYPTQSMGAAQGGPPPRGGAGGPGGTRPSHEEAIQTLGSQLSEEVQTEMLETVESMQQDGASFEDIQAYVDGELESHGVDLGRRRGQLVHTTL